jgi:N-methylhydantoinase A
MRRLADLHDEEVESAFVDLERAGRDELSREGITSEAMEFRREFDLRYVGQSYELTVAAGSDLSRRFHLEHDRVYGFSALEEPVECVNLRVTSIGRITKPQRRPVNGRGQASPKDHRQVYFAEEGGYVRCPIYDRYTLSSATSFNGPAVVEEFDSTTIVHPGFAVRVDDLGNIVITR